MSKIPTAQQYIAEYELGKTGKVDIEDAVEALIEFAKLHVQQALKAAVLNAETKSIPFTNDEEIACSIYQTETEDDE